MRHLRPPQADDWSSVEAEHLPVAPTLTVSGCALFGLYDALRLIDYCERNDIGILGFDGFVIEGGKRRPDLGSIADFSTLLSDKAFVKESAQLGRCVIGMLENKDIVLEFVLARHDGDVAGA